LVSKPALQDETQADFAPAGPDGVVVARTCQKGGRQGGDEGRPGAVQKRAPLSAPAAPLPGGRSRLLLLLPEPPPLPRGALGGSLQRRRLAAPTRVLEVHQPRGNQLAAIRRAFYSWTLVVLKG